MSKKEHAEEAMRQYEAMEYYRKVYNNLSAEEREQMGTGQKTRGQYTREAYELAKARFTYHTNMAHV